MMKTRLNGTERPKKDAGGLRHGLLVLAVLLLTCVLMAGAVSAESISVDNWADLKNNFTDGNTITLCDNIELEGVLTLNSGDVVLDLGSYTLSNTTSSTGYPIQINGGNLTITGSGCIEYPTDLIRLRQGTVTIQSGTLIANGGGSVVVISGSPDTSVKCYSNLIVGKDAVLKGGWYVAFITYDGNGNNFGVTMDIAGQLLSCENPQYGGALYINGQIQGSDIIANPPVITIRDTAVIAPSKGNAVYAAGYGKWIIEGGMFEGTEALSIKSGSWKISGGTFIGEGPFSDPAASNNNGAEATGAAVSITTNKNYAQNVELTITGGTFSSTYQSAFYEGPNTDNSGTALKKVDISGGSFTTGNESLSAVTLKNEDSTAIVSIKDAAGNNLLYRGVNLTGVAEWTGDATNGYTLVLDEQNANYKLMDAFATTGSGIQITADGVMLDGNNKEITTTGTLTGYILKVDVDDTENAEGVTLQKLDITGTAATGTGNYGGITVSAGANTPSVPVTLRDSTIDMSDVTATNSMNPAVYFLSASGSEIANNVIKAGSTEATGSSVDGVTSRGIVIDGGSEITVSENDVTMGTGAKVSIGIQFKNGPEVTLAGNSITATNSDDEKLNRAIDITTLGQEGESYTITGTKLLAEDGASFESAVNVIVSSSAPENAELSLTTNGNDFSNVEKGIALVSWAADPNPIKLSGSINADDFPGISQENIIALSEILQDKVETDVDWTHDPEPQPTYSSSSGNMNNAYRVLFNDGATTLSVQTDLSSGDKLTKPETPVKDGYTFAGWYKDSACTQAWDFETGISGDMTLYAKWTAAGSSGETEATPTATSTAVTTPQPTKTQSTTATTSAPQATTAAGVSPTLTQAPAPVAGALFGLLAAGLLLRRRFQ